MSLSEFSNICNIEHGSRPNPIGILFGSCTPLTSTVSLAWSLILFTKSIVVPVVLFLLYGRGCTRWSGIAGRVPERCCCCVSYGLRVRLQVAVQKKEAYLYSTGTIFSPGVIRPLYQIGQSKCFNGILASRNPVLPKRPSEEGAAALIRGRTGDATS